MLPSEITMQSHCGYRKNIFEGWRKMPEATIIGDGYKVEFFRLSERTIDVMCDALNGWYNVWTKFRCEYTDSKGTLSITVRKPEDADKLFNLLANISPLEFEHEDPLPAVDVARIKLETIIWMIRDKSGKKER